MQEIYVKKRNGEMELLDDSKYHEHVEAAVEGIDGVSASEIEFAARMNIVNGIRSSEIQQSLILATSDMIPDNPRYSKVAARLLNQDLRKKVYGDYNPKDFVKHILDNVENNVYDKDYLYDNYTKEEVVSILSIIDYDKDDTFSYAGLRKNTDGYLIKKYGEIKETPQESYLMLAMFTFAKYKEKYDAETRLKWIKELYTALSDFEISLPTPIMGKLRTTFRNFISCVLIPLGDTKRSIAKAFDTILTVVASGAGIGLGAYDIRGLDADIDNGRMKHVGAFPIIKSAEKTTKAFVQPDRDGSTTVFYNFFNVEIEKMLTWGNARGTDDTRARDVDHAINFNQLFFERYAKGQDITLFFTNDVPMLKTCLGNHNKFKLHYEEYERTVPTDRQIKIPASLLFDTYISERVLQSRQYATFLDAIQQHGGYDVPTNQSNLCVSGDTKILTKKYGDIAIKELIDMGVHETECWNGEEYSLTPIAKTGTNVKLLTIETSIGTIQATPYHKWYVDVNGVEVEKRTIDLVCGDVVYPYKKPFGPSMLTIHDTIIYDVTDTGVTGDSFCGTEPKRNRLTFNGVLTGNCLEITQPTFPLESEYNIKRNISFNSLDDRVTYFKLRNELFTLQSYKQHTSTYLRKEMVKLFTFTHNDLNADVDETKDYDYFDLNGYPVMDETGVCIIAGINIGHVKVERLPIVSELLVRVLDELIDYNKYESSYMEKAAKMRRGIGIGFSDVFHLLALNNVKYNTKAGMELINERCELATYHMIKTSIQLAEDFGPCILNSDSKYSKGIFPIDTYNKHVDELVSVSPLGLDWNALKERAKKFGTRHSTLFANAPYGNSAIPSGSTSGIEPPRSCIYKKSGLHIVVPGYFEYGDNYTTAWSDEFNNIDYFKFTAVIQKWWDQALSLNQYHNLLRYEDEKIPKSLFMEEVFICIYYGHKTMYYLNVKSKEKKEDDTKNENKAPVIEDEDEGVSCESGACSI